MSTLIAFSLWGLLTAAEWFLWAVFLRVGLRWAKVEGVTKRRIVGALLLAKLGQGLVLILSSQLDEHNRLMAILFVLCGTFLLPCVVITMLFGTKAFRSVQAWLPTWGATMITIPFAYAIVRYVTEAFVLSSISMAPTLLGPHLAGSCSLCGETCYASHRDLEFLEMGLGTEAICTEFHITRTDDVTDISGSPDRVLVAKYLRPERWDMVAFESPEDPSTIYVMRLVGLPDEEITIKDGRVFAEGQELTPPEQIASVEYVTDDNEERQWPANWGSPEAPAVLGADEYFVLGDFSVRARDSRLWVEGASGHPPYAVPESYLVGVVTHCYWPAGRWRIFR